MTWNDILGFLIVLIIFLLPLFSKLFSGRGQKKGTHPLRIEEEEVAQEEVEEEENSPPFPNAPPVVPRMVQADYHLHSGLEAKKKKKKHHKLSIDPLSMALKGKTSLQAMMLASQILEKPKSLQDEL